MPLGRDGRRENSREGGVAIETKDQLMLPWEQQQMLELMRHYIDSKVADGTVCV